MALPAARLALDEFLAWEHPGHAPRVLSWRGVLEGRRPAQPRHGRRQPHAYLLIDPDTRDAQAFRCNAAGEWVVHDMTDAPALQLPCIGVEVVMADVFDGVASDAAAAG